MELTIFQKIVEGNIPSFKIYEDDKYYAFLDINPLQEGHTLVIPKEPTDYIFDLEDKKLTGLMLVAKKVAKMLKKTFNKRIGVAVVGFDVPHAHIHLIPIEKVSDMNFKNARPANMDNLKKIHSTILKNR